MTLRALYVDFNSYFASVELQLCPELRGKPAGVLPVMAETTCCIAASYKAKRHGVKTGTSVRDARRLCPDIRLVPARPAVYVERHHRLVEAVESCLHVDRVLSIDEMACRLSGSDRRRERALSLAALGEENQLDVVARLDRMDPRPDLRHHPRRFVPRHDGHRPGAVAIHNGEIRVAQARRLDRHERFPRGGRRHLDGFDGERAACRVRAREAGLP
ncbi:MAG: hypothetical protein FJY34_11235 [Betaproteobacteria bacterium]|nr:hypothetical protein [Betaproteobacteria bacterium]